MNLPDLYARVCAVRPELAVMWLGTSTNMWVEDHPPITVWTYGPTPASRRLMLDGHAAALILARWVEALPDGSHLMVCGSVTSNRGWTIYPSIRELDYYPTPIEALAAFYLGETA